MIEDKTKKFNSVDASQQGTVQTISVPEGSLWYIGDFHAAGDSIKAASGTGQRDAGVEIAISMSDDPNSLPIDAKSSVGNVNDQVSSNLSVYSTIDTYVSGGTHDILIRLVNQYGDIDQGQWYIGLNCRRVL